MSSDQSRSIACIVSFPDNVKILHEIKKASASRQVTITLSPPLKAVGGLFRGTNSKRASLLVSSMYLSRATHTTLRQDAPLACVGRELFGQLLHSDHASSTCFSSLCENYLALALVELYVTGWMGKVDLRGPAVAKIWVSHGCGRNPITCSPGTSINVVLGMMGSTKPNYSRPVIAAIDYREREDW